MSYTLGVRERLAGIANVYRAPDNCRSTRQTLDEIETYLGELPWDVIHFNWGIHDLTHLDVSGKAAPPPEGKPQIPLDQYRDNIRELLRRLHQTDARLIWASTTPVGRKAEIKGFRRNSDVIAYNHAAKELLKAENVRTTDLYSLVKPQAERWLSDGVHLTRHGQTALAKAVAQTIQNSLADENSDSVNGTELICTQASRGGRHRPQATFPRRQSGLDRTGPGQSAELLLRVTTTTLAGLLPRQSMTR